MASNVNYKAYFSFLAGQNSAAAPDNLREDEMQRIVNFDIITRGALKSRPGTVYSDWEFVTTPGAYRTDRLVEYPKNNGTTIKLVLTNGNLYKKGSTTALLTAVGAHVDYTVYQDKLWLLLNAKYYVYDGTTISEVTNAQPDSNLASLAKCKYIINKGERIYAAGNPDEPTAIYYSQIGDATYFKTGDFRIFANSGDGDAVAGLHEFQNTVLVFKSRGIWKYEGVSAASDAQFTKLNAESGTKAFRTIKNVQNYVFFLGDDGVYAIKTTSTGVVVTEKISQMVDDVLKNVQYNASWWLSSPVAEVVDGKYMLSFSDQSATPALNNRFMVCHIGSGIEKSLTPWTEYKYLYVSDMLKSIDGTLYLADALSQGVIKFDETKHSDRGNSIQYEIMSKDYDLESPIHVKKVRRGWIVFRQYEDFETTADVNVVVDYVNKLHAAKEASESLVWDKGEWGEEKWGWLDTVTLPFKIGKKGIRARVELTGYSDDTFLNHIFVYGFAFEFKTKRPYK